MKFRSRLLAALVCVAGCGGPRPIPSAGTACQPSELPICSNRITALVCRDSFWSTKLCAGGCTPFPTQGNDRIACSGEGDACTGATLCSGAAAAFDCENNVWVAMNCHAPKGCAQNFCDQSVSVATERCLSANNGFFACSTDGHQLLQCDNGFWTPSASCSSCTVGSSQITCNP